MTRIINIKFHLILKKKSKVFNLYNFNVNNYICIRVYFAISSKKKNFLICFIKLTKDIFNKKVRIQQK